MALFNMKAEMTRYGVMQEDLANLLSMSRKNVNLKLNEKIPMTIAEGKIIRDRFFPKATLDYLFESDLDQEGE